MLKLGSVILSFIFASAAMAAPQACPTAFDANALFLGSPWSQWQARERAQLAVVEAQMRRRGVRYRVERRGPSASAVVLPVEGPTENQAALALAEGFGGLALIANPLYELARPASAGAYARYLNRSPKFLPAPNMSECLNRMDEVVGCEHALVVPRDALVELDLNSILMKHELGHGAQGALDALNGPGLHSVSGQYDSQYDGPSYQGFLEVEEQRQRMADVISAAASMESPSPPIIESPSIVREFSFKVPLRTDRDRLRLIAWWMNELLAQGASDALAAEAYFKNQTLDIQYILFEKDAWGLFILPVANGTGSTSLLRMRAPILGSPGVDSAANRMILDQEMRWLGRTGMGLYSLARFSLALIRRTTAGQRPDLYRNWIQFLASAQGLDVALSDRGTARSEDDFQRLIEGQARE